MACIVAVSQEIGLEKIEVYKNSINRTKFKMFLDNLRSKYPFDDIMLVMDNLSIHKSLEVKERMEELGFKCSYTPEYSPQYNGSEEVIAMGKHLVKKNRLNALLNR